MGGAENGLRRKSQRDVPGEPGRYPGSAKATLEWIDASLSADTQIGQQGQAGSRLQLDLQLLRITGREAIGRGGVAPFR